MLLGVAAQEIVYRPELAKSAAQDVYYANLLMHFKSVDMLMPRGLGWPGSGCANPSQSMIGGHIIPSFARKTFSKG